MSRAAGWQRTPRHCRGKLPLDYLKRCTASLATICTKVVAYTAALQGETAARLLEAVHGFTSNYLYKSSVINWALGVGLNW